MHSHNQQAFVSAIAAERFQAAQRRAKAARLKHPPPVKSYAAARVPPRRFDRSVRRARA
jgi:hypothetical protein